MATEQSFTVKQARIVLLASIIIVLLFGSVVFFRPAFQNPDSDNNSALEFKVRHSEYLVLGPSELLNQSKSQLEDFFINFVTYADLEDYGDILTLDLAYAFKVNTNNFDVDTNELVSTEASWDSSLVDMDDFNAFISETGMYQSSDILRMIETTSVESGDEVVNDTNMYTIRSSSSGEFQDIDTIGVLGSENNSKTFVENEIRFFRVGQIEIEASDSIKEFFVQTLHYQFSKHMAELVDGKCVVVSELKKCVTSIEIIFRTEINWQYIASFDRTYEHQPYTFNDFGDNIQVNPYIGYIGYEENTQDFTTPVYRDGYDSTINLAFGNVEYQITDDV